MHSEVGSGSYAESEDEGGELGVKEREGGVKQ